MASRKRTPKPAKAAETPEQEPVAATAPAPEPEAVSDTAPVPETAAGAPEPEPEPEAEAPAPAQGDEPEMTPPASAGEEAVVAASPPATLETLVSGLKMVSEAVSKLPPMTEEQVATVREVFGMGDHVPVHAPIEDLQLTIVGPAKGFRRAGRAFGPEPVTLPVTDFHPDQVKALMDEAELLVTITLKPDTPD